MMVMEKYETCKHVLRTGVLAVYVTSGCPRADMIHGTLVSSKIRCRECKAWDGRPGREKRP